MSLTVALSRVRGLKPAAEPSIMIFEGRTLTSAWIETFRGLSTLFKFAVALSRVRGLKPSLGCASEGTGKVALSRVRGLKPEGVPPLFQGGGRTLTSAWIETCRI